MSLALRFGSNPVYSRRKPGGKNGEEAVELVVQPGHRPPLALGTTETIVKAMRGAAKILDY